MSKGRAMVVTSPGAPTASVRWISPGRSYQAPVRCRTLSQGCARAAAAAWAFVERVLGSRALSNSIVVATTFIVAVVCFCRHGIDGLIGSLPSLAVIWSALYGLVRLGRSWRGVRSQPEAPSGPSLSPIRWRTPRC
jgi:hypothetical protein